MRLEAIFRPRPALETDLKELESQLQAFFAMDSGAQFAAGKAFADLVSLFGSVAQVWDEYPSSAGLVLILRTRGARDVTLE